MFDRLTLVGSIHWDRKGPQRLERLLWRLEPDFVCLEMDETRADFYEHSPQTTGELINDPVAFAHRLGQLQGNLDERINPEILKTIWQLEGFEYRVAKQYTSDAKVFLVYADGLDVRNVAADMLRRGTAMNRELSSELAQTLEELDAAVMRKYANPLSNEGFNMLADRKYRAELVERDRLAERQLGNLCGNVAYIGGLGHLYGPYFNLYERLKGPGVTRMTLADADHA